MIRKLSSSFLSPSRLSHSKTASFLSTTSLYSFSKQSNLQAPPTDPQDLSSVIPEISRPQQPSGGIYNVESIMQREEVSEQLKLRLQNLRRRHDLLRVQLQEKVNIPFLLCGVNRKTYHESFSYMAERVMSYYRIHPTTITDYLLKIYKASLYSIPDRNTKFMEEYWEAGFREKVLQSIKVAKDKGYTMRITEEKRFTEELRESCKIVDAVMLRGLSIRREENDPPKEYHRYTEDKEFGLVTFTPNHLTSDNEKFINPESNKTVFKGYEKMVLRVLLLIKSPLRLTVPQIAIPDELNTYEHIVIMENEMLAPPHLQSSYKLETLVEWLGKYRFGEWRVVDIDNFMRGNSPFRLHKGEEDGVEQIFRNTIMDKSYYCNIRDI